MLAPQLLKSDTYTCIVCILKHNCFSHKLMRKKCFHIHTIQICVALCNNCHTLLYLPHFAKTFVTLLYVTHFVIIFFVTVCNSFFQICEYFCLSHYIIYFKKRPKKCMWSLYVTFSNKTCYCKDLRFSLSTLSKIFRRGGDHWLSMMP